MHSRRTEWPERLTSWLVFTLMVICMCVFMHMHVFLAAVDGGSQQHGGGCGGA